MFYWWCGLFDNVYRLLWELEHCFRSLSGTSWEDFATNWNIRDEDDHLIIR